MKRSYLNRKHTATAITDVDLLIVVDPKGAAPENDGVVLHLKDKSFHRLITALKGDESRARLEQIGIYVVGACIKHAHDFFESNGATPWEKMTYGALLDAPAFAMPALQQAFENVKWSVLTYLEPKTFGLRLNKRVHLYPPG
jgi:hypothetical protein